MPYYTQRLLSAGISSLSDAQVSLSDPELLEQEGPNAFDDTVPLETSPVESLDIFNMPGHEVA